jgi:hypothetical protein
MNEAVQCDELPAANSGPLPPELAGHLVPVRFLLFAMIGGFGVLTHLATLWFGSPPLGPALRQGRRSPRSSRCVSLAHRPGEG